MTAPLASLSACDLATGLRRKDFSAREVLADHLARIDAINPTVNAIVSLDVEGAQAAAADADRRCAAGEPLGPLHGLPVAYKDTHATAGMRTTYGSPLHVDTVPDQNDEIVDRIERAGAIRVGKTNVPEFAAGSHTFNTVFGTTRNPWDTGRSAGGSSGGAAAALAARMLPIADGTDMGGSLRNPASFCNVVGLRPTPGRVPEPGTALGFSPLGVGGPMARSVDDLALLLSVVAGPHPDDPLSLSDDPQPLATVVPAELRGRRVAWAPTLGGRVPVERQVLDVLERAVALFGDLGAEVEENCPDLDGAEDAFRTMRAAQFDLLWSDLLAAHPEAFKDDLAWNIRQGQGLSGRDVSRAWAEITRLHRVMNAFFDTYDVLLAPVSQLAPFAADLLWPTDIDGTPLHTYLDWMASCYLISATGVPALSIPAGFTPGGLPVGLQIITRARSEARLLAVAKAFEQATGYGQRSPEC